MAPSKNKATPAAVRLNPFRRAVIRGLGVLLPPLLTIVIFVWIGNTVAVYLLEPLESQARALIFRNKYAPQILPADAATRGVGSDPASTFEDGLLTLQSGRKYRRTGDDKFVPEEVFLLVQTGLDNEPMPPTARGIYERYIDMQHLQRQVVIPLFLAVFILVLYLLGKFLAKSGVLGVHRALGAPRSAIFLQRLFECELVGLAGGLVGLGLAALALPWIEKLAPGGPVPTGLFAASGYTFVVALALALAAGLLSGLYPAWRACRIPPAMQLKIQ